MERKEERHKCDYCGKPVPLEPSTENPAWLMEKASMGLRLIRWLPQSRIVWDLSAFYQFCSFACAEHLILDFIRKERWRSGQHRVGKEKVKS